MGFLTIFLDRAIFGCDLRGHVVSQYATTFSVSLSAYPYRLRCKLVMHTSLWILHERGFPGVTLPTKDNAGGTPAQYAARNGHGGALCVLHELGVDPAEK